MKGFATAVLLFAGCGLVAAGLNPSLSCVGKCGSQSSEGSDYCYCDDYCTYNGDCCDDAQTSCSSSPAQSASCQSFCGGYNSDGGCFCDSVCSTNPYGDCCSDWGDYCSAPPVEGTCSGNCGGCSSGDYSYGNQCCCDCCDDISQYCAASPPPAGSCSGYCSQFYGSSQSCHCDEICTSYGDCCDDYGSVCGADNSCQNHCGDAYVGNCHCDAISTLYQDSCTDYSQYCGLPPPPASSSPSPPKDCTGSDGTCSGNCGSHDPTFFCYCDDYCTYAGDCCCDVATQCGVAPSSDGSCQSNCGSSSLKADGTYCYCDDYCTFNNDCCDDHSTYCGGISPPPPDTVSDCVAGSQCGNYYSTYGCGCDDACTLFGDCCYNYDSCTTQYNTDGDSQDNAIVITNLPYHYEGSTEGHTDTAGVPTECSSAYDYENSGVDIWFEYTPATSVSVNISLCAEGQDKTTTFDSYVYVEKKSDSGSVGVACNDDADRQGCGLSSELTANLQAGETYYIIIDGYGPQEKGDFSLTIGNKAGNTIDDAIPVNAVPFEFDGNTQGYDDSYTPPVQCASYSTAEDIVFRLSLTKFTTVSVSLCGSDFDNLLYVMDSSQTVIGDKCNDDSDRDGCDGDAFLTLDINPFQSYYIVVDGYGTSNGEFRLEIDEVPGNTESDAILVNSLPYDYAGDTSKYTSEFSGPVVAGCVEEATAPDVFFEFFPFQSHHLRIDVCSPDFDTILYVYTKGAESTPVIEKCNDDTDREGCSKASSVEVDVSAFQTYYIVVDGIGQNSGAFELTIKENTGDTFDDPLVIPSLPYVYDGSTTDYSKSFDIDNSCVASGKGTVTNSKDIVFQYYSPQSQTLNITTCGTTTDTIVAVYTGSGDKPNLVQCNDDSARTECGSASELSVTVSGLTYYYIVVDVIYFTTTAPDTNFRLEINTSLRP